MSNLAASGSPPLRLVRRPVLLGFLAGLVAVAFLAALAIGAVRIPLGDICRVLLGLDSGSRQHAILVGLRLPRALLCVSVGVGLGLSGGALQGLFRNPLADPGLVGISGGAALGAVAAIVLGHILATLLPMAADPRLLPVAAFFGGLAATYATVRLADRKGIAQTGMLLLAGIAVNAMAGSLMGLLIYMSDDAQLREITFWMMGSLARGGWSGVMLTGPFVAIAAFAVLRSARALDALLLGEREALHLGVGVERLKSLLMIATALAVGASVAVSGIIAFVGVVVPHLVRMAAGPDHRVVLPGSALLGAALLLVADTLARVLVAPAELPVGLVTSLIGSPFFMWLLMKGRGFGR